MNWNRVFISGFLVWLIQLTVADSLMIDTVRPDFIGILIMYWAVKYGRFLGTISGLIFGLIIDFSGVLNTGLIQLFQLKVELLQRIKHLFQRFFRNLIHSISTIVTTTVNIAAIIIFNPQTSVFLINIAIIIVFIF